jgi:uncharacterized membrane protein YozB (DUF420 family)
MADPLKIALEMLLLFAAIALLWKRGAAKHHTFILWFTAVAFVLNIVFYYLGAWPLYASYGQSEGVPTSRLHLMVWFDIVKWAVLAYFLSKFALATSDDVQGGGFQLIKRQRSWVTVLVAGLAGGLLAVFLFYSLSFLEVRIGVMGEVSWKFLKESDLYFNLGVWGGLRNLTGEEILTRLGVQTLTLFALRKYAWAPLVAILASSLYFEFWHNGFRDLYFMNFTASMVFGLVYQKFGYESAAISHCVSDWLALVVIPRLLF